MECRKVEEKTPRSRNSRGEKKSQRAKRLPSVTETKNTSHDFDMKPQVNEESSEGSKTEYCGSATQTAKSECAVPVSDEANDASSVGSKVSDSGSSNTEHDLVNADVLLFGKNFEKQPQKGSVELSSDQDSTGGEEDEVISNYITKHIFLCVIFIDFVSVSRSMRRGPPGSCDAFTRSH